MSLAGELRAAGLKVIEVAGWDTRGDAWSGGKPVGIMHHHTAAPVPYPVGNLSGDDQGRIKANINIKQDGTVYLIAYKACNYASGNGSSVVLAETKKGIAPPANAKARGLADDTVGNKYYVNFENDHLGDGSPIPTAQYKAILTATEVTMAHYGITKVGSVVSHAEWTARKIDPYWNNNTRTVAQIRADLEDDMSSPKNWDADDIKAWRSMFNNTLIEGTDSNFDFHVRNTYALVVQIRDMISNVTGADLDAIAQAVNDEQDRRARERLGSG